MMWWRYLATGVAGLAVILATRRTGRILYALCLRAAPAASLAPGMLTVGAKSLPDAAVKGHLFDVDGTLIDTMPLFFQSWIDVCDQASDSGQTGL